MGEIARYRVARSPKAECPRSKVHGVIGAPPLSHFRTAIPFEIAKLLGLYVDRPKQKIVYRVENGRRVEIEKG